MSHGAQQCDPVVIGQRSGTVAARLGLKPVLLHKGAYQWKDCVWSQSSSTPPPSEPALSRTRTFGFSETDIYCAASG